MNKVEKQRQDRRERRAKYVEQLGGRCVDCGAIENLQFDHIDSNTKVMNIAHMVLLEDSYVQLELAKCQLLCKDCHLKKHSNREHGTLTGYKYCTPKCEACRKVKAEYVRNYRLTHARVC